MSHFSVSNWNKNHTEYWNTPPFFLIISYRNKNGGRYYLGNVHCRQLIQPCCRVVHEVTTEKGNENILNLKCIKLVFQKIQVMPYLRKVYRQQHAIWPSKLMRICCSLENSSRLGVDHKIIVNTCYWWKLETDMEFLFYYVQVMQNKWIATSEYLI